MSVLVTGGAGYIGSHAVKALRAAGQDVIVYDNLSAGHKAAAHAAGAPLEVGDITDVARLRDVMSAHGVSAVMHFALRTSKALPGRGITWPSRVSTRRTKSVRKGPNSKKSFVSMP